MADALERQDFELEEVELLPLALERLVVEEKTDETIKQLGDFKELFPTRYWDTASTFYGSFGSMEDLREEFFERRQLS